MNFSTLHVIHIYNYQKPETGKCPIDKLKSELNLLMLSTCMRHVYIFSSEQLNGKEKILEESLKQIETPQPFRAVPHCEYLQGELAYRFLLFWVIGGLNPKKIFNDERILGDLRRTFTAYKSTQSGNKKLAWEANK